MLLHYVVVEGMLGWPRIGIDEIKIPKLDAEFPISVRHVDDGSNGFVARGRVPLKFIRYETAATKLSVGIKFSGEIFCEIN